ncbi:MAG: hypothetical protein IJY39_11610, partial [Clostridia bacterium]|nr:hypothetical protein [Clostridia bacterium]
FQNFFKFFSTSFQARFVTVAFFGGNLFIISQTFRFVKGFFKSFLIFSTFVPLAFAHVRYLSHDSLNILPLSSLFVKRFFESFLLLVVLT